MSQRGLPKAFGEAVWATLLQSLGRVLNPRKKLGASRQLVTQLHCQGFRDDKQGAGRRTQLGHLSACLSGAEHFMWKVFLLSQADQSLSASSHTLKVLGSEPMWDSTTPSEAF